MYFICFKLFKGGGGGGQNPQVPPPPPPLKKLLGWSVTDRLIAKKTTSHAHL